MIKSIHQMIGSACMQCLYQWCKVRHTGNKRYVIDMLS